MTDVNGVPDEPRPTVLLIDDSTDVRTLVRTRLEMSGLFEVVGEGQDGDEALALAYRLQPSLLLLDTSMPTMDGLEALPAILALSPRTVVVMFTGFEERGGLAARAFELGASDFIEKSIRLEDLPHRLLNVLDVAVPGQPPAGPRHLLRVIGDQGREGAALDDEQAVLDEHLEQFRELFDQAAIGMATLTLNGTVVRANRALATLMSCKPADLVGEDYGRLTRGKGEVLDRALEAISTLGEDLTSFEHVVPDVGDPRTVQVTLAPIRDSKGQPLYVFAQIQDITAQRIAEDELRRSEENFRLLVTAVREYAIFLLDTDGVVVNWNSGAQRIKGYTAEEIIGRHFRTFYPPEERESGHPEHNLEIALREGEYAEEGWRVRKDGSRFWASVVITAVHDDTGRHVGFAKITRDQTQQRDYEEQRKKSIEQQTHLLAVTAHELRTPTAVIDGSAGTLQEFWDRLSSAEHDRLLTGIRSSAQRLHRLVSDLATASRLQGDTLQFRKESVDLAATLQSAVTRATIARPGAEITLDVPEDATFEADAGRLGQAIDNLLDNAIRHGAPPVGVNGLATVDTIRIRVTDGGSGVPDDLLPRLFEQFAIAGPAGGTGLGLYLVREIARGHGGEAYYHPPGSAPTALEMRIPRVKRGQ